MFLCCSFTGEQPETEIFSVNLIKSGRAGGRPLKWEGGVCMKDIVLISTERQLLLYDIFKGSEQVEYEDITSRLPIGKKMVQRDIKTLTDAGLIRIRYSKKDKAYIHDSENPPSFNENAKGKYRVHLVKLRRIATLMNELSTDTDSYYEEAGDAYYSCKTCYYELFPEANERMRQRDFRHLNNIGYTVTYDNCDRRYKMWYGYCLREDFDVFLKDGKLMRHTEDGFDL